MQIEYTTRIHKEGKLYVAHAQELDVSSAGSTVQEAEEHLREAVKLFVEEAQRMGTLQDILDEAGYDHVGERWQAPHAVKTDQSLVTVP